MTDKTPINTEYQTTIPLTELNAELDRLWQAIGSEPALLAEVAKLGLPANQMVLLKQPRKDAIKVSADAQHADPVTIGLIVAFTPVAVKITKDIWEKIILPHLRKNWGDKSIVSKGKK